MRFVAGLVGVAIWVACPAAWAGRGGGAQPSASAAEIPALAQLLEKAGWEPTPELSGVFRAGSVFRVEGATHSLMVRSCFDAEEVRDTYTSAEVVSQMQAGVRVKLGLGGASGHGELVKRVKFGTPEHATIERLAMVPTPSCREMLQQVPRDALGSMYAVQEVLTAEIAEQTCGRVDASGRFVGVGQIEGELAQACMQESLEPVAVAYRVVPLSDLLPKGVPAARGAPVDCPFGAVETFSVPSLSAVAVNGEVYDVRGVQARSEMAANLARCGFEEAAAAFEGWRTARRTTNIACATLLGCYPFGIGIASGFVAHKKKQAMVEAVQAGR